MSESNTTETQAAPLVTPTQVRAAAEPDAVSEPSASSGGLFWSALSHPRAPLIAGAVLALALGAGVLLARGPSLLPFHRPDVVMFDPVRFTNAQRAAASILAVAPNADVSLTLTQVAKRAESVIQEEAHGAVVMVKQALVAPVGVPDITDAVLDRFGLPRDVPTISTNPYGESLENLAPTDSAFSSGKLREDYRLELEARRTRISAEQAKRDGQEKLIP